MREVYSHYKTVLIFIVFLLAFRSAMTAKAANKTRKSKPNIEDAFSLSKTLVKVGQFIGQHKYFERDQRKARPDEEPLMFMERFPIPPLESIPLMVRDACDRGVVFCLKLIHYLSYKRLTRMDLFTLRVSASYYLCWYTMQEDPLLRHFGSSCQVPYKDPDKTTDYRGWDRMPYDCALHNFCPDPCCGSYEPTIDTQDPDWQLKESPKGFAASKKICAQTKGYPCGITELACSLDFKRNRNWNDLMKNKLNTTCTCGKVGKNYLWNDKFKMCVDQDECHDGNYECEPNSICRNIESDYYCTCRLGYKFYAKSQTCVRDPDFEVDDVLRVQAGMFPGMTPPPKAQQAVFQWATYFYWLIDHSSSANRNQHHYSVVIWWLAVGLNFINAAFANRPI